MKTWLIMGLFGGLAGLFGGGQEGAPSLEQQLRIFKELGFELNEGVEPGDIDRWGGEQEFVQQPFALLYQTPGQTLEREPWTPLTDRCWDFDTEAIEDHGSYRDIINNLGRITRGELLFEDVKDHVDIDEGVAWVSFTLKGQHHKWDMKVDDDWVDTDLFSKIVALTKEHDTRGRYTYFDTGGQNAVLGYETPEHLQEVVKRTGLRIEWLNE
jgi:hypothetical protein